MKLFLFAVASGLALLWFASCSDNVAPQDTSLPKIDTFDCRPPLLGPNGPVDVPYYSHHKQRRSADGGKIAFLVNENVLRITDVKSGNVQSFILKNMMPPNVRFNGCFGIAWCPYTNDKLALNCVTSIDTTASGKSGIYGQNLFILSISDNKLELIQLPRMPKSGPSSFLLFDWLRGSVPANDSLLVAFGLGSSTKDPLLKSIWGAVVLQRDTVVRSEEIDRLLQYNLYGSFLYSPNRQHVAALPELLYRPPLNSVILDGVPLRFKDRVNAFHRISWSPHSKKLAVTVSPVSQWTTVWIIDVERWQRERPDTVPVQSIDFQKRFCMYTLSSVGNLDAEFLTNTTLAVSMHRDGDKVCPIWEITTDGRLLRQLTKEQ